MIVPSRITLKKSLKEANVNYILAQQWMVLNEIGEYIEEPNEKILTYDNEKISSRYNRIKVSDLFEHYMDSYNIKLFKLYETLGYVPNEEAVNCIDLKIYDLLESNDIDNIRATMNIASHVVVVDGVEIGYLVLNDESSKDDLANFYFVDEETAKSYFRLYFGNGKFKLGCKNSPEEIMASEIVPKPLDINVLLSYYSSLEDVIFGEPIFLFKYFLEVTKDSIKAEV